MKKCRNITNPLVSIIIPAYNVEKYVDCCIKSVVNQTYKNIEILLVDDGSTDKTYKKCMEWEKLNSKIRVYSKSNEGLGPTRNYGMHLAKGKYIYFVDSDDWLDQDCIKYLVDAAEETSAEVVAADYTEYNECTKEMEEKHLYDSDLVEICSDRDKSEYLMRGWVMVWSKLYRKDFLENNEIEMPSVLHEDNAVFPIIVFRANKIVYISKSVYVYRTNRIGSIVSNSKSKLDLPLACEHFLYYFMEKKLFEKYYSILKRYFETRIWFAIEYYSKNEQTDNIQEILSIFAKVYDKYFRDKKVLWEYQFGLFGGFGCRYLVQQIGVSDKQLTSHYPFSSIIAQMTTSQHNMIKICNKNPFREEKIKMDFEGQLRINLCSKKDLPDFFFIDFIEERFDVAELEDGNYITLSDAYLESEVSGIKIKRKVIAGTKEYMELWKKKCEELVNFLKSNYQPKQIILIKNRLSLYVYDETKRIYSNRDKIIQLNNMYQEMEKYFLGMFNDAIQIYELPEEIYSSKKFKFGAEPQYLAEEIYKRVIMDIRVSFDKK